MELAEFNKMFGTPKRSLKGIVMVSEPTVPDLTKLTLAGITRLVRQDWKNVSIHAEAYLGPMGELSDVTDNFYSDSGRSVVLYFLANATGWRGPVAKAVKAELKRRVA